MKPFQLCEDAFSVATEDEGVALNALMHVQKQPVL